jgi:hypothetical protein
MAVAFAGNGTNSGTGGAVNLSLALPASIAANDILLAHIYDETQNLAITPPSGWVEITPIASSGQSENHVFWTRAAGGETGSVTFTHANTTRGGIITRWTGCVTSGTPFDTPGGSSAAANATSSTTTPAVSDTTAGANRLVVFMATDWQQPATFTPPTGFTENIDVGTEVGTVASLLQAAAGATGSITATASASGPLTARLLLLIPASAAVSVPATQIWNPVPTRRATL